MTHQADFYADPLGYVMWAFPWRTERSIQVVELQGEYRNRFKGCRHGPMPWQCEVLDRLGSEIKARGFNGFNAVKPVRMAIPSGHGVGVTALASWIAKFILDTRAGSEGVIVTPTRHSLTDKAWPELDKWHSMSRTRDDFEVEGTIMSRNDERRQWRVVNGVTSIEGPKAIAGTMSGRSTAFFIFDGAAGTPDPFFDTREGCMRDGEPMIFDFGQQLRGEGRFTEECRGQDTNVYVRRVSSEDVEITNKTVIAEWADTYGRDSDHYRTRVLGLPPK